MSNPTPSRKDVTCDHCGAKVQKKNLKSHTVDTHGKDVKVKERQPASQQTLIFTKRTTEDQTGSSAKRSRPFTDYPEQVALMVKGKVYMENLNHSTQFASEYLNICQK